MTHPSHLTDLLSAGTISLTRAEAIASGITDAELRLWTRQGLLKRHGRGNYEIAPLTPPEFTDVHAAARARHLRSAIALIATLPDAYLTGRTAALHYALPTYGRLGAIEIARQQRIQTIRPGVQAHRAWGNGPIVHQGVLVQPVSECVISVSTHSTTGGLMAANAALREGLTTKEKLAEALASYGKRRFVRRARVVVQLADSRIESPGESQLQLTLHRLGIPVESQVEIFDSSGNFIARVDFLVRGSRTVIEYDGLAKYAQDGHLGREKLRDIALERAGYRVVHIVKSDLNNHLRLKQLISLARG